ncbi:hypothetical protein SARC_03705 [Sphaeroforma arctica JP610]|uniref:SLC12A transporter C-terminal domain-containing protein n=1 Tax=Sphaeroforma arctica JP610 TaxID=667725 RepID=A0A0L0G4W9_9EUKA|nr:hypothetical protein SARC_03705 [Sphaeroforma arctica JP610]KNC84077.1 hypothetical protein SARC_03705 [Sphaeroforma arctica JP610]|eukprot:XP_014157979.1 hypothetical protein SARC_03705 [Sphaeroforma arctica JP610]
MMFLLSYATVNFTCFLLSVLKSPSWRPGFKYYHPYITALAGTVCCFALMFALNWIAALVSVVLCVLLAFYIEYRVNTEIWGSGLQSMQLHLATKALISMEQQEVVSKYIMMLKLAEARNARARDAVGNIILGSDMDIPAQMLGIVEEDNNSQRRSSIRRTNTMLNQLTGLDNFLARQLHEIPDDFKYNRTKSWVPRFLVLVSMDTADDSLSSFEKTLLSFLYMLAKGSAKDIFIMVGNVLKRDYGLHTQERFLAAMRRKVLLQGAMQDSKINGLAEVVVAKDTEVGANILIQTAGVGSLRPNTIIAGWPRLNTPAKASYVVSLVSLTRASSRACIFLKHGNSFPEPSERVTGTMDLWWVLQEGGMLLLVSFLLTQHKSWKGCKLRLFTVADVTANSVLIEQQLRAFLRELRIKAEVKVIEITTEELNPFTNQMTIARNQSNAAAMRLRGRGGASMFPSCVDQLTGVPMGSSPSSVPSGQQSSSGQRSAYTKITGDTDTAGPLKQSIEGLWKGISIAPPEESKSQGFLLGDDSDDSTLDVDTSISAKRYHSADITDSNNDSRKPQSYLGKTTPGSRYRVSPAEQKRSDATDDKSDTKGERQRLQPNTPQIQTQTRSDIDIPTQAQTQAQAPPHNTHTHTDSKRTEYGKDSLEEIDLKTSERRTQRTDHMASGESDAQVIKDKRKESLRLSMSSEALLVGKDITTEPIAEGIVPHFYDASASTPNSPVRTRANTVTSTDSSHSNTHTHDATENSRKSTASYDNAKGSTSRLRAFSRLRKAAESLAARTSKGFSTNKLAEGEHIPEEGVEVPMRETSRTSQESGKTSSDGKQKKNLFTAPGLKQAMHTESSNARLVIMNLPVPTDESAINPSGYLTLVNELTEGLHNVVLVNGLTDGTDVISVYQS